MSKKKRYLIDTSVIIDNPLNLLRLSDNNTNEIFLCDVVLSELDKHKTSERENVKFSARQFFASIVDSKFKKSNFKVFKNDTAFNTTLSFEDGDVDITILTRDKYSKETLSQPSVNDAKIIEIGVSYKFTCITNDSAFKTIAKSKGCKAETLKWGEISSPEQITFMKTIEVQDISEVEEYFKDKPIWEQVEAIFYETYPEDGGKLFEKYRKYYIKDSKNTFKEPEEVTHGPVKPINIEQKIYFDMLMDKRCKMMVVSGSTGSGKTLLAVQAGMKLVLDKKSPINGIVFMRYTVNIEDKFSALGYRKGSNSDKLDPFNGPLYNAINFIAEKRSKKDFTPEERLKEREESFSKFNIEIMDIAHSRGITIENKFVIYDESQNTPLNVCKTIGTRLGRGCKAVFMGDFNEMQVDHPYLSPTRNSLVSLLHIAEKDDMLAGVILKKTVRSELAEWFGEKL